MKRWSCAVLMVSTLGSIGCAKEQRYNTIEGRVYARADRARGFVDPIVGAKVSNNWDQTTATTDSSGRFAIRVRRVAADEFVVLRVDSDGKAACRRLIGMSRDLQRFDISLDGGPFGSQRCGD